MGDRSDHRVLVLRCDDYDRERLEELIAGGMRTLGYAPRGKVYVKPNVVFANDPAKFGSTAWTHTTLVGAASVALSRADGVDRIDIGEKSAIGFPTRHCYRYAGYYDELKRIRQRAERPVALHAMEEDRRDEVFVGGAVHDTLHLSRRMARADTLVYLPKLKCHCVSNMTSAVKLNIGICHDDERSIRHDFLLDDKIVDLLGPGWPDFTVVDAIEVGVGNEAFPFPRHLGLVLMGRSPVAVDVVGARLLGLGIDEVPYLQRAIERGYTPASLDDVTLLGDLTSWDEIDAAAKRLEPYDHEFHAWWDVQTELDRLGAPMTLHWGASRADDGSRCKTGCVMGLKMFLGFFERFVGAERFAEARPIQFVIGRVDEPIEADGRPVFFLGSCARAEVRDPGEVVRIDKCFITASDLTFGIGHKLGMPAPLLQPGLALPMVSAVASAAVRKAVGLRYAQDVGTFVSKRLLRRI